MLFQSKILVAFVDDKVVNLPQRFIEKFKGENLDVL